MWKKRIAHRSPNEGGSRTCGHGAKSLSGGIRGISPDDSANGSEQRHGPRGYRVSDEGHGGAGGCRGRVHLRGHDQFGWRQGSAVAPTPKVRGRLTCCGKPWKASGWPIHHNGLLQAHLYGLSPEISVGGVDSSRLPLTSDRLTIVNRAKTIDLVVDARRCRRRTEEAREHV